MFSSNPSKTAATAFALSLPFLAACGGGGGSGAAPPAIVSDSGLLSPKAAAPSSAPAGVASASPTLSASAAPASAAPSATPRVTAAPTAPPVTGPSAAPPTAPGSSAPTAPGGNPAPAAVTAAPADSFVDAIGVDSHFNYGGTSYTGNFQAISSALIASGIRHLRDGEPGDNYAPSLAYLGAHGIKHSVFFPVTTNAAQIVATLELYAPFVDFIEPQNEYDLSGDPNWASALRAEQPVLDGTVQSNPAFGGINVLGPSFGRPYDAAAVGPLDGFEDGGNLHDYTCNLNPGTTSSIGIAATTAQIRAATATKPIWTTEVGYEDDLSVSACALSDAAIAKYTPRTIADRWLAGEPRTYLYQFADMAPATGYSAMGLVTQAGVPKPQFTALQSMISLLSDPGSGFATAPLAYTLGGNTQNVQQLLLQKRNGDYFLLLWLEVPSWNPQSQSPLGVAQQTVTLTFGSAITTATAYTYGSDWSLHGTGLPAPARQLSVSVGDSITFVKLHP